MKIADFFAQIGFKVDTRGLQEFNDGMNAVVSSVKGLALGLTGVMTAWELMQVKIGKSAQNMLNFKLYTGEGIEEVRKLATVMQSVNLNFSMDTLLSDISNFKEAVRRGQIFGEGGGVMQTLRMLGVTGLKEGGIETINDLLNALKQVPDEATRAMILSQAGLSKQWLNVLDLPQDQFERIFQANKDIFPDEKELKRRQEATLAIYLEWLKLVNLFETKVTDFAPILLDILTRIRDILSDTQKLNLIIEGIKWFAILMGITMVTNGIFGIIRGLWGIISIVPRAVGALIALGGAAATGLGKLLGFGGAAAAAKSAGGKAVGAAAAKAVGGRVAGAAAASFIPVVGEIISLGLLAWGAWDLFKLAKNWMGSNNQLPISSTANNSAYESVSYDWNRSLASMSINAQNVYIKAERVYGGSGGVDTSTVDNNVMRSLYDMEAW